MFRKIPYTPAELKVIGMTPPFRKRPGHPIRNNPVSARQNLDAVFYEKKPFWMPTSNDMPMMESQIYLDNLGRVSHDNTDVFGIDCWTTPTTGARRSASPISTSGILKKRRRALSSIPGFPMNSPSSTASGSSG